MTLGDGIVIPKQAMILELSVQRESGSQEVVKRLSELPVAYVRTDRLRYAFYSPDNITYYPLTYNGTNDTLNWPLDVSSDTTAKVIMLNSASDPNSGYGMAFYSNFPTNVGASHRLSVIHLTAMSMEGSTDVTHIIPTTDFNWYTVKRIVAVGNLPTIKTAIDQTRTKLGSNWGNWTP